MSFQSCVNTFNICELAHKKGKGHHSQQLAHLVDSLCSLPLTKTRLQECSLDCILQGSVLFHFKSHSKWGFCQIYFTIACLTKGSVEMVHYRNMVLNFVCA